MALKKADDPIEDVETFNVTASADRVAIVDLNGKQFRLTVEQYPGFRRLVQAAQLEIGD